MLQKAEQVAVTRMVGIESLQNYLKQNKAELVTSRGMAIIPPEKEGRTGLKTGFAV
jgi:hypothetical protein